MNLGNAGDRDQEHGVATTCRRRRVTDGSLFVSFEERLAFAIRNQILQY